MLIFFNTFSIIFLIAAVTLFIPYIIYCLHLRQKQNAERDYRLLPVSELVTLLVKLLEDSNESLDHLSDSSGELYIENSEVITRRRSSIMYYFGSVSDKSIKEECTLLFKGTKIPLNAKEQNLLIRAHKIRYKKEASKEFLAALQEVETFLKEKQSK